MFLTIMAPATTTRGSRPIARTTITGRYRADADVDAEAGRLRAATQGLPGLDRINIEVAQNGPPNQNQLQVIVTGADFAQVRASSERVLAATSGAGGLTNVRSDLAAAKPEIRVAIDPNRAAARGLTAVAVAGQVRGLITGQSVGQVSLDGGRTEVYAAFAGVVDGGASALEAVRGVTIGGTAGPVRLVEIATVERADGSTQILRVDRERAVTINGTITGENLGQVTGDTRAAIDALGLSAGVTATVGGASEAQTETFRSIAGNSARSSIAPIRSTMSPRRTNGARPTGRAASWC